MSGIQFCDRREGAQGRGSHRPHADQMGEPRLRQAGSFADYPDAGCADYDPPRMLFAVNATERALRCFAVGRTN